MQCKRFFVKAGIACLACENITDLCRELEIGAGAVLISEEQLLTDPSELISSLAYQQLWSDMPIIVLSQAGTESVSLNSLLIELGNISVVERPIRINTLISIVRSALRGREKQYSIRDHITLQIESEKEKGELLQSERTARLAAEKASRIKDEFLSTISHELRTPLNAILGWTQILKREVRDSTEVQKKGLDVITRSAQVQAQLIEDLLDMGRIISGKLRLEIQGVELREILNNSVASVIPAAEAKDIKILQNLGLSSTFVRGDQSRLQQVLWNLLTNAIKFTPKGGEIRVGLVSTSNSLEFSVSDNGQGIRKDFLPYIFDRFRQGDSSIKRSYGGLGLGLSIVKHIVELHGGTIGVASEGEGKGSTFTVHIPVSTKSSPTADPTLAGKQFPLDPKTDFPEEISLDDLFNSFSGRRSGL